MGISDIPPRRRMSLFERSQPRFDGAEPDGFALIVNVPHAPLRPCPSNRSPVPADRSPRFITELPLAFRLDDGLVLRRVDDPMPP